MQDIPISKVIAIDDELRTAIQLIKMGFGELQNIGLENDFYHLPHQLLSSGFERLMKCYICFGHHEKNNAFPLPKLIGTTLGHDLLKLKEHITNNYFQTLNRPALEDDLVLMKDENLNQLLELLSEFGKYARYYNLDIVVGSKQSKRDIKTEWQKFMTDIVINDTLLLKKLDSYETTQEVIDTTTRKVVITLERFTRLLARQFTLGGLGSLAQKHSGTASFYLHLGDERLGNTDYRKMLSKVRNEEHTGHKRTTEDELERQHNPNYKSKKITKSDYDGDWPFYVDEIIVECREKHWCIITINNEDFALNANAKGRYKIEDVHEAGQAVLGKSIGSFLDLALKLGD